MTTPEHQFEVVARAYYKLKLMGITPTVKLLSVGRDTFELPVQTVERIRFKARYFVEGLSLPSNVDAKGWQWPTDKERETQAA